MKSQFKFLTIFGSVFVTFLWVLPNPTYSMMSADIGAAKEVAEAQCSSCHVIPEISEKGVKDAPTFATIANQRKTGNWEALATILGKPHWPENGNPLSGTDIDNLVGYILSFTAK